MPGRFEPPASPAPATSAQDPGAVAIPSDPPRPEVKSSPGGTNDTAADVATLRQDAPAVAAPRSKAEALGRSSESAARALDDAASPPAPTQAMPDLLAKRRAAPAESQGRLEAAVEAQSGAPNHPRTFSDSPRCAERAITRRFRTRYTSQPHIRPWDQPVPTDGASSGGCIYRTSDGARHRCGRARGAGVADDRVRGRQRAGSARSIRSACRCLRASDHRGGPVSAAGRSQRRVERFRRRGRGADRRAGRRRRSSTG